MARKQRRELGTWPAAGSSAMVVGLVATAGLMLVGSTIAATTHGARERESDGAFSPRDSHHFHHGSAEDQDNHHHHDAHFDREAILGSAKEAEKFAHMAPAQAKMRLRDLALRMDRNKDGVVDKAELHQWILRSFRMLVEEEAEEKFDESDDDEDGYVTWAEYKEAVYDSLPDENQPASKLDVADLDELAMMNEEKILFQAADTSRDGKLDRKEFVAFNSPEDFPDVMRKPVLDLTFSTKDKNGDRRVDFQEFIGDRGQDKNKEWIVAEKDRFDNDLDSDKDGSLDESEVYAWIVPDNDEIARDEVDHLFAGADDDHDDRLTLDEIEQHYDIFLGSEATDYGEMLHEPHKFDDEL